MNKTMKPFLALTSLPLLLLPLLLILLMVLEATCSLQTQKLYEFQRRLREKTLSAMAAKPLPSPAADKNATARVFYPIGYGADPTGAQDSSDAILSALAGASQVEIGFQLLPGIKDLGGAVVDLQGGQYKIGKPIRFPPGIGNVVIQSGTLRASDTFPNDRHLIELWAPTSQKLKLTASVNNLDQKDTNSAISYEDITFRDILFDSSYGGGGLLVIDSARIRIDSCFFLHFTSQGILVQRGHETFISSSFLGQHSTVGGDEGERDFTGTAIDIASNDNGVTDVAIFSAGTGIVVRGEANMITGVHCYNKATFFGGVGILVKAAQTRIVNCYFDFNAIVIEDPFQVHVSNGFFLGDGNVVLKSIKGRISGLNIVNNMFSGDPKNMVPIVKLDGQFREVDQVVIDQNMVNGMRLRSTVGKLAVPGNGTKWVVDFSSVLVFPDLINHVHYSFYAPTPGTRGFPVHAVTNVSGNVVVVESDKAVNAVVSVVVDQNNQSGERNFLK